MIRRIVFSLVVLVSIAIIAYYIYDQRQESSIETQTTTLNSPIPADAIALIEYHDFSSTWSQLNNGNLFYEELLHTEFFNSLNNTLISIDTTLLVDPEWISLLEKNTPTYSLHPKGDKYTYLISLAIDQNITESYIKDKINELFIGDNTWNKKTYNKTSIQEFNNDNLTFFCAIYQGYFLLSPSTIIVENAIRTVDTGNSIMKNKSFKDIRATASVNQEVHIYVNYEKIQDFGSLYIEKPQKGLIGNTLGGWSEFDLSIQPNSFFMNGLIATNDSLNYFLNCFDNQESAEIELTDIIPTNIAWYTHASISNPKRYSIDLDKYWTGKGSINEITEKRNSLIKKLAWDPIVFQNLLDDEIALGLLEPQTEEISENYCLFMSIKDRDLAIQVMNDLLTQYRDSTEQKCIHDKYRGYDYWTMGESPLLEVAFGPLFSQIQHPFYTIVEDRLVAANSLKSLKLIINHFLSELVIEKDLHYNRFMNKVSKTSSFSIYNNIARSPYYYKHLFNKKVDSDIEKHIDIFRKFHAFSIQYEKTRENKYYQTVYCEYNPIYKNETASLWEYTLDTSYTKTAQIVINHYTQAQEILIQDDRKSIYLLSNTGKLLWKRELEEEIIGDITQVDRYGNNKLQMVFISNNYLYMIDRNGEDVEGFPVKLPSKSSSLLSVMDYENDGDYRLIVGTEDTNINNYNIEGEIVDGWNYNTIESPIVGDIKHLKLGVKDYILARAKSGKIQLLNRKGEQRHEVSDEIHCSSDYMILSKNDIALSELIYIDSTNAVIKAQINGEQTKIVDKYFDQIKLHSGIKNYIVCSEDDEVSIYNDSGEQLSKFNIESGLNNMQVLSNAQSEDNIWISFTSVDGLVFVYSMDGKIQEGFPLNGSTLHRLVNINSESHQELIIGDEFGVVYVYTLGF